jgi:ATP-dependent helicase/nuclease subunit B
MKHFFEALLQTITDKTVVITANERLAFRIIYEYRKKGNTSQPIQISSLDRYLEQCWQKVQVSFASNLKLLNVDQTQVLWETVVRDSSKSFLLQVSETAYLAEEAWQLCCEWQIELVELSVFKTPETQSFLDWAYAFKDQCQKAQWLDQARLLTEVLSQYRQGVLEVPSHIILVGFLEFSPLKAHFFDQLKRLGCLIECYAQSLKEQACQAVQVAFPDIDSEIYAMARWAKQVCMTQPDAFVICIVHNLQKIQKKIRHIFNEVFFEQDKQLFNVSAGESILDQPLVYTVFEILKVKTDSVSVQDVSHLLRSPFISKGVENFDQRALLDAKIRDLGRTHYTLSQLIQVLSHVFKTEDLCGQLHELQAISIHQKRLPSAWVSVFLEILHALGWPGCETLSRSELRAVQRFHQLLEEFAGFDLIQSELSYEKAVSQLHRLAAFSVFQPETDLVPIQVLGLLEAMAQPCTHIWMMGLDDQSFPSLAKPHPLLPFSLQCQLNMPHVNAERELRFAQLVMKQVASQQADVVFSYLVCERDQLLRPSPLIQSFLKVEPSSVSMCDFTSKPEQLIGTKQVPALIDDVAPTVFKDEVIYGGTDILKQQAACPFRAFVKHRLHAKALNEPEVGLCAVERGLLVHKVLEYFWRRVYSQQALLALSADELEQIVSDCVQKAVWVVMSQRQLPQSLIRIERMCLQKLILDWLQYEKRREHAFEVVAKERRLSVKIGDLIMNMQIDRIDQIDENSYVLIDYKTGKVTVQSWYGDRPDDPQLLVYAISSYQPVQAIAFASLSVDGIGFKGVGGCEGILPGMKVVPNWQNQLKTWRETIQKLADDFCKGDARIDPKDPAKTCRYCEFKILCRGQTPAGSDPYTDPS